jgi:hypothetical protein
MLVSNWNFDFRIVVVMLLTRHAVPIWVPLALLSPKRFQLELESPMVLMESAEVFMMLFILDRSSMAGDEAITTGMSQITPVMQMILSQQALLSGENMIKSGGGLEEIRKN